MTVQNAKIFPKVLYGMHFYPGVAEYKEPGGEPYRIFLNEATLRAMDPTFVGKPVYVKHVDGVDLDKIQEEADGYVIESFYNKADGKHWVKFIVVSDRGHEAVKKGWRLSNAYFPKKMAPGGLWNGVEFAKEVIEGEFEHLAIVDNPRYDESIILDVDQFKNYNSEKELELSRVANSKEEKSMFEFLKKTKVENGKDLESMSVVLPKSKKEVTITQLVNEADEKEMNADKPVMANEEHMVKCGDEEMSVKELTNRYMNLKNPPSEEGKEKQNDEDAEAKKKALELAAHEDTEIEKKKESEADKGKEEEKKKNENFDALQNAHKNAPKDDLRIDLSEDRVARGKSRYGSEN